MVFPTLTYIFLAGIGNSEPEHWQSIWYRRMPGAVWVEHEDWDWPQCEAWIDDLHAAVRDVSGKAVVVAHSLGCLLLAEWASQLTEPVEEKLAGALLVAPPDVEADGFPRDAIGFKSAFETRLPCAAVLVASHDDPYAGFDYAERLAQHWQARLVDVGEAGHINLKSGLADWPRGQALLMELVASAIR